MCGETVVVMGCVMEVGLVVLMLVMTLMLRIMVSGLSVVGCVIDDGGNIDGKSDVLVVLVMMMVMNCVIEVMMVVMVAGVVEGMRMVMASR